MNNAKTDIYIGPYRSGKTIAALLELCKGKEQEPLTKTIIIVPSARYARLLKSRLLQIIKDRSSAPQLGQQQSSISLFGLEILPFYKACSAALEKLGQFPRAMPDNLRANFLAQVLDELQKEDRLKSIASIARYSGTANALLELFDEFSRAGFSPEELVAKLEQSAAADSRSLEFATIYKAFWSLQDKIQLFDQKRIAMTAREHICSGELHQFADRLLIDGFDRISKLQAQIFAGLAACSGHTIITYDFELADDLDLDFSAENPPRGSVDYVWKQSGLKELLSSGSAKLNYFAQSSAVKQAQRDLLCKQQLHLEPYMEATEIARQVKADLLAGLSAQDLLVVCRNMETYRQPLESAFENSGVPYFIDGSDAVSTLPLWQFFRQIMHLSEKNFSRAALVELLRSPYFSGEGKGLAMRQVSELDKISFSKGLVIQTKDDWLRFAEKYLKGELAQGLETLVSQFPNWDDSAPIIDHCRNLESLLENYMRCPADEIDIHLPAAQLEREAIAALRRGIASLLIFFDLSAEQTLSFGHFIQRLEHMVESSSYARQSLFSDPVLICSAEIAPNKRFQKVYIAGANEGEFPRHSSPRGFLAGDEISAWLSFGIDIRNPRSEAGFELALFRSLLQRATSEVRFSLSLYDLSGAEKLPSFFLSELFVDQAAPLELPWRESRRKPMSERDGLIGQLWAGTKNECWPKELGEALALSESSLALAQLRTLGEPRNVYNGYLRDFVESGALKLNTPKFWTASKLNTYGKCPFRFFVSELLDMEPREEPEPGLDAALRGIFYHRALEIFFRKWSQIELSGADEVELEVLELSFAEAVNDLESNDKFIRPEFWEQEKKELYFRLQRFVAKELERLEESTDGLRPTLFELSFGDERRNSHAPLCIDSPEGQILVRGTIDRIDLPAPLREQILKNNLDLSDIAKFAQDGANLSARVIDYKSGTANTSKKDAEKGRNLQISLYALALQRSLIPSAKVKDGRYLIISSAKAISAFDFEKDQAELLESTEDLVRRFVANIKRGIFLVEPSDESTCCKGCPHRKICRIGELKQNPREVTADVSTD